MSLLLPPDANALKNLQKLCEITDAYTSSDELDALFIDAFKEIISWHRKNNPFYDKLTQDFDLDKLQNVDVKELPFIHANFFKMHESLSVDKKNIFLTSFAKPKEVFFALRQTEGTHEFDRFGTVRKLQEYYEQNLPVRIHGFPSARELRDYVCAHDNNQIDE